MRTLRHWSVRHAGTLEYFYKRFSSFMTSCAPVFRKIGFARVERAVIPFERLVKSLLSRPEWVDFWTLQLAYVLQNRKERDHDFR